MSELILLDVPSLYHITSDSITHTQRLYYIICRIKHVHFWLMMCSFKKIDLPTQYFFTSAHQTDNQICMALSACFTLDKRQRKTCLHMGVACQVWNWILVLYPFNGINPLHKLTFQHPVVSGRKGACLKYFHTAWSEGLANDKS